MSLKSNLTEVIGIYFIFTSPVPLIFSFVHIYVSLPFIYYYLEFPSNYYEIFLLYSFFIMISLGWCIYDKEMWAVKAAILFTVISIILGFSLILYSGITAASPWFSISSLIWTIANFIFLGALLFDFPWNPVSHKESSTLSSSASSRARD
jgi:hypothetical protein